MIPDSRKGRYLMTKAQRPAELREAFVTNEEQRRLEIEEMRLVVKCSPNRARRNGC